MLNVFPEYCAKFSFDIQPKLRPEDLHCVFVDDAPICIGCCIKELLRLGGEPRTVSLRTFQKVPL